MLFWIAAALSALFSLTPITSPADTVVGTALTSGPVYLNGKEITKSALVTSGDRLRTGPGGVAVMNLSSTDRFVLGERSSVEMDSSANGVIVNVESGRLQVSTNQLRLRQVRYPDEAITITTLPGSQHDYLVTRQKDAAFVYAQRGDVTIADEGYGNTVEVPQGKVGVTQMHLARLEMPDPQNQRPRPQPTSTTTGTGTRAGQITALVPEDHVTREGQVVKEPLAKGTVINWHDAVTSGDAGRVRMVLDDGSILNLGSATKMNVEQHNAKSQATVINLEYGRLRSEVRSIAGKPNAKFEIQTETAICGVLGTDFYVEAGPGKTVLVVFKGKVFFKLRGKYAMAAAEAAITVLAGQTTSAVGGAVAAPAASSATSTGAAVASTAITSQAASAAGTVAVSTTVSTTSAVSAAATAVISAGVAAGQAAAVSTSNP